MRCGILIVVVAAATIGCRAKTVNVHDGGGPNDAGAFAPRAKVDVLFMINNNTSGALQYLLRTGVPGFVSALQTAGATHPGWYHVGVIDSDLGAGPYTLNQGQCHPGGDGAKLQVQPSNNAVGVPAACSTFALSGGVHFIDWDQTHGTDNLNGTDPVTAYGCMASVGPGGCGIEQELEAVYQALHDPIPENAGFLRDDALLVVVFATDEDDCSIPADSDLFDLSAAGIAKYGPYPFRCTQYSVACGDPARQVQPIDSMGSLPKCRPLTVAEGSKVIDVQKYIDFFTQPASAGGVKADPSDVILMALAPPAEPFSIHITSPCVGDPTSASCATLTHSCISQTDPKYFGDPTVRLSMVVQAAPTSQLTSNCGSDAPGLNALADKIVARLP